MVNFTNAVPYNVNDFRSGNFVSESERERQTKVFNADAVDIIGKGIPSVFIGAIDTIAQSLTPDELVDEETITNYIDSLNKPLGQFYREHREGSQTIGEIGSSFVPIIGFTKLAKVDSFLGKAIKSTKLGEKYGDYILSSGKSRQDFIDRIDQEAKIFKDNFGISFDEFDDSALAAAVRNAKFTAAGDMFKESMAANAAIALFYNDSDMAWSDDLSTMSNVALYLVPDTVLTGLAYRFTGTAIKKHLQNAWGEKLAAQLNPFGEAGVGSVSLPGRRGPEMALHEWNVNRAEKLMGEAGNPEMQQAGQQLKAAHDALAVEQALLMAKDNPFGHGITRSITLDAGAGEIRTLVQAGKIDPSLVVSVRSLEQLTPSSQKSIPQAIENRVDNLKAQLLAAKDIEDEAERIATLDKLGDELEEISQLHPIVVEIDGSITPLKDRKFSLLDDPVELSKAVKVEKDAGEKIYTFNKQYAIDHDAHLGVTEYGKVLIKPLPDEKKNQVLNGVNLTTVLSSSSAKEEVKEMKLLMRDMSKLWHYKNGSFGNKVYERLRPELQREIENWTSSSSSSMIRQWEKNNDPKLDELISAYKEAGMHQRLHELADADGTITLWRGESKQETTAPTNNVVSMAATPEIAAAFGGHGGNMIKRRVPVEDVIMIVGGLGDEAEFIVKGNLNRNKQAIGSEAELAIQDLSWDNHMALWALTQKAVDKYNPATAGKVYVHGESNIVELNFAKALQEKFPDQKIVQIVQGQQAKAVAADDLDWLILQKQFHGYQQLKAAQNAAKAGLLKLPEQAKLTDYDIAARLNMPNPTVGGRHPMMEVFDELQPKLGGEMRELSTLIPDLATFKAAMARHVNAAKLGEGLTNDLKFTGTSLLANRDVKLKPAVVIVNDDYIGRIGEEQLKTQLLANKLWQNEQIAALRQLPDDAQVAPIHKVVYDELLSRPELLQQASRSDHIFEGTQKNLGIIGQQSETYVDGSPLQAMDRLKDIADKRNLQEVKKIFAGPDGSFTKTFNQIQSPNNRASLDTFNIVANSIGHGWRLLPEPKQLDDGLYGLVLDPDDLFNRKKYKELFGISLDEVLETTNTVFMPVRASAKYKAGEIPKPAAMDELALQTLTSVVDIEYKKLAEYNFSRRLRGLSEIPKKPWHLPPQDLTKGYTIYLTDPAGHAIGFVNQATKSEALRVANKEIANAKEAGQTLRLADSDSIRQYYETFGDTFRDMKNFSITELQTGGIAGKAGTNTIQFGTEVLKGILGRQQRDFEALNRNIFATFFESSLNYSRSHIMANTLGDQTKRGTRSLAQQQYERITLGRSALSPNGLVGKTFNAIESAADDFFRSVWDKVHAVKKPTAASLENEFEGLNAKLGDYNPFKSAVDMLEANENVRVPPTLRGASSALAKFTTDMVLRIMDTGMPLVNFASLISVTPSVYSAMRRQANETHDMWVRRIGAVGTPVDENFAMPNTSRLVMNGIDFFFHEDTARLRKLAAERGYIKHDVAERLNLWTSPKQGWLGRNADTVINKLSWPTDKSEELSRDIAFGMAFRIGRDTLKLDEERALLFAHTHANKVIADFRPTNRAQMFQGAAGMPLGLFTTWAMNWLQRVFGDVEAGRLGATFWQAGMQQFLFGANSIPGVQQFIDTFTTSYDGKTNVTDALDAQYGRSFTDWFLHGTLNSLTGVDMASRGDVTMPAIFSGEDLSTAVPGFSVISTLTQGVGQLISSMRQQGFDPDAISEIISVYGVNGKLRHIFEVLQNTSVNRHGETVTNEIRSLENLVPRIFEMRSVRETRKAQELQRNRMQRQIKKEHIDRLSKQLRTAARAGDLDGEMLESALMDYYKAGGSMPNFKRYLREQILSASFEKSSRLLLELMRKSDEQGATARLLRVAGDDFAF